MASEVTTNGLDWFAEKSLDDHDEVVYIVAVGDGTSSPTSADSSLDNELYRANSDDNNCVIQQTSTNAEFEYKITVSGGTEVPAGSTITEFALISSGSNVFMYREVDSSGTTVASGDRKTFQGTINFQDL